MGLSPATVSRTCKRLILSNASKDFREKEEVLREYCPSCKLLPVCENSVYIPISIRAFKKCRFEARLGGHELLKSRQRPGSFPNMDTKITLQQLLDQETHFF